ncbi:unnamed protein product [Calicophoron daubneyi]|uniref:Saposin B-type domain-containing protein n=1 Tax=Calicophoron daubneyi TaxID=300641 RepID=A0AAV2TZM7_CALDB
MENANILCDICKGALVELIKLIKGHAAQELIDKYIDQVCQPAKFVKGLCKKALRHAVEHLKKHIQESSSTKVCKAIHIC